MSVWRTGRKLGVTLYRDEVFVGHVCSAMVAAEIVETMNRVGKMLDEVRPVERQRREAAGEREATPQKDLQKRTDEEAPAADPNRWPPRENCYCGPPDYSLYAHRVGTGPHCRDQGQLSRVDPYDTTKGFTDV